ncbi:hypothetical protein [Zhongshania marina]|uniref:Uncharacterized protein n=1 Tax=Zhongshania marina TaxID=2304603 RepID=A0A2S4HKN0_9GAMM|nr:hypothetical protein [Marortus luteolus]POP54548.1 hypothetical protein C0068_00765 [Marortus luteolus]
MASAEAQLLDAIKRKKAQQLHDKEMLRRRSELYRDQLVNDLARPEYVFGGMCIAVVLFSHCRQQRGASGNEQREELGDQKPFWHQIIVDVLDRQISRLLNAKIMR